MTPNEPRTGMPPEPAVAAPAVDDEPEHDDVFPDVRNDPVPLHPDDPAPVDDTETEETPA